MMHMRYQWLLVMALGSGLLTACGESPETTAPPASESSETSASSDMAVESAVDDAVTKPDAAPAVTPAKEAETADTPVDAESTASPAAAQTTGDSGTDTADASPEADQAPLAADAGATLYDKQCKICHEGGLLNAPKFGDKAAWAPRLAKGKETLYLHSAKGFNKMPAQVNADVSEAQVHAAVDYMIDAAS